jgi:predicted Zn-dependent protease
MKRLLVFAVAVGAFATACTTVPVTGRRQLSLVSSGEMVTLGEQNYKQTLEQSKLSTNKVQVDRIRRVGGRIQKAVEQYMAEHGMAAQLEGFKWEFNLIENDTTINAWCMPGGKVAFYTGILPICKDDSGIAVVMGHEIAHAIANHSGERMSQAMALDLGGQVGSILLSGKTQQTQQAFQLLYPIGAQVGVILPYSRSHELEADKMGLIFMAMAGYNPETAIAFWERMAASSSGGRPPQFLSTHPAEKARIDKIRADLPEIMKYYNPAKK